MQLLVIQWSVMRRIVSHFCVTTTNELTVLETVFHLPNINWKLHQNVSSLTPTEDIFVLSILTNW